MRRKEKKKERAGAGDRTRGRKIVLGADVGNMEGAMLANPAKRCFIRTDLNAANRYRTTMSPQHRSITLVESPQHGIKPANPAGALDYGGEHRLHGRRRATDDGEHLGRRCLVLQGL